MSEVLKYTAYSIIAIWVIALIVFGITWLVQDRKKFKEWERWKKQHWHK